MTVYLSPIGNGFQFFDSTGKPLNAGLLNTYAAGSSTPQATYTTIVGNVANANPIVLGVDGRPPQEIWFSAGVSYKFILTDSLGNTIANGTYDNLYGIGDITTTWVQRVVNVAALKAITASTLTNNDIYTTEGYTTAGDGGFGTYRWNSSDTTTDNAGTVIQLNSGGTGRFNLLNDGMINVKQFGGAPGTSNNAGFITAALATGLTVLFNGIFPTTSTIVVPNGSMLVGLDRSTCGISYTGIGSGFSNTNGPNSSGYGLVTFRRLKVTTASNSNIRAAIELRSGGYSYYEIDECYITGTFLYGVVCDGTEVSHIHHNIIENGTGVANSAGIWLVNGNEWTGTQNTGYTNGITINDNQFNNHTIGIIDDGGARHTIRDNNFSGHSIQCWFAGVQDLTFTGNAYETTLQTGQANILFTNISGVGAAVKAACKGAILHGNNFSGYLNTSSMIKFSAAMHYGFHITGNTFGSVLGRVAAIDLTYLGSSFCGFNYDGGGASEAHYTGNHQDADGNFLLPAQNGAATTSNGSYVDFTRTDKPLNSEGGFSLSQQLLQCFTVEIINTAGTLQHRIVAGPFNLTASGYATKISGASATLANTPTVGAGTGFTNGAGIDGGNAIVLNTAAQTSATLWVTANVEYHDGNTVNPTAAAVFSSTDVNGTTRNRLMIYITNAMTGANWTINTTNLPAGKSIFVKVTGWLA